MRADRRNASAPDTDLGAYRRTAASIDDGPTTDQELVGLTHLGPSTQTHFSA